MSTAQAPPDTPMPTLTPEETEVLVYFRRLVAIWRNACVPEPSLHHILQELKKMSDTFSNEITTLRDDVAAQSTVIASATAAFRGLAAQLAAAEASARSAGATDAQVASVSAIRQTLEINTAALAAAIPANTPAATEPAQPDPTMTAPSNTVPATTEPVTAVPTPDTSAAAS